MADTGHVKIARRAYEKDVFWTEPREFSKWEAWEWMIQAAAWRGHDRVVGMTAVELGRGEFLASIRYLAKAWGWSPKKVRTFLALVTKMDRVRAQRETHAGTVYLLVNYDTYQNVPDPKGTRKGKDRAQEGHSEGTGGAQEGHKEEAGKAGKAGKATTESPPWFDEAWSIYPKRAGGNSRKAAEKAWRASMRRGVDPKDMLAGTRRYRDYIEAEGRVGTVYVKMGSTFYGPDEHWSEEWVPPTDTVATPAIQMSDEQLAAWSQPR